MDELMKWYGIIPPKIAMYTLIILYQSRKYSQSQSQCREIINHRNSRSEWKN